MALAERELIALAEKAGIRIEWINGLGVWEAFPAKRHQQSVDRIRATIHAITKTIAPLADDVGCGCIHYADLYVSFPDGSLKRPDIAIFCKEPEEEDEAVTLMPEAVIEVISPGYEAKDVKIGQAFYLQHGVKDVVLFDPRTLKVQHYCGASLTERMSPVKLLLQCGCSVIV